MYSICAMHICNTAWSKAHIIGGYPEYKKIGQCPFSNRSICIFTTMFPFENVLGEISNYFGFYFEHEGKEFILRELMENGYVETIYNSDLPIFERCEGKDDEISFYLITPQNLIDYLKD